MPTAIALLSALLVMIAIYEVLPVATRVRARQFDILRGNAAPDDDPRALPFWRLALRPLGSVLDRVLPRHLRTAVRQKLYWANFSGSWLGWNEVEFWSLSVAIGAVAFVLLAKNPLVGLFGAAIGALLPYVMLRNVARKTERALARELPDALYLLAAMVSVGIVLPDALRRITEYQGVLARWIQLVLAKSHGGDLLAKLHVEAEIAGQPRLLALATKLELIETKGAAGSTHLLRALADDQAREYRQEAERRAKGIGGELTFPILICFFFPYLFVVAAPLFANILQLFVRR